MISTENIVFRTEQEEAINFTVTTLKRSRKVLWNAKMRFGKTLCAIEAAHPCSLIALLCDKSGLTLLRNCSLKAGCTAAKPHLLCPKRNANVAERRLPNLKT